MASSSSSFLSTNATTTAIKTPNRSSQRRRFLLNRPICVSSKQDFGKSLPRNGKLSHLSIGSGFNNVCWAPPKRSFAMECSHEPSGLLPFLPPENSWMNWLWGLVAIVPLVLQRLLTLTKEVEAGAETVEMVADAVEELAGDVEKLAEDVGERLPEGGGKLKEVIGFVQNVAQKTAKGAQLTQGLMDKVEEVDQQVESIVTSGSKSPVKDKGGGEAKDQD